MPDKLLNVTGLGYLKYVIPIPVTRIVFCERRYKWREPDESLFRAVNT